MESNALAQFEIEEHVAEHNEFFLKQTHFTLDDMDTYAEPFGKVLKAVNSASEGLETKQHAIETLLTAISQLKAMHAAMDTANADAA